MGEDARFIAMIVLIAVAAIALGMTIVYAAYLLLGSPP